MNQIIKKMAIEAINAQGAFEFLEGEVVSSPPNIRLRLKRNSKLVIPSKFIIVPEHLKRHKRRANISSSNVSESMSSAGDPSHTHNITSITLNNAEIEFTDELKVGDRVMVAAIQGGQSFFIIDRF
jgi:hypothetical protein